MQVEIGKIYYHYFVYNKNDVECIKVKIKRKMSESMYVIEILKIIVGGDSDSALIVGNEVTSNAFPGASYTMGTFFDEYGLIQRVFK